MGVVQHTSRVNPAQPVANAAFNFESKRGTYYNVNLGGHLKKIVIDDVCVDPWESNVAVPMHSTTRTVGALANAAFNFESRRGTFYDMWSGLHRRAIRLMSCGTGFTGVYVEAPRLLIDAGGTGGVSGVAGGARRSFH